MFFISGDDEVFGLFKRKDAKEEFNKISNSFKEIKKNLVPRKEIELLIENAILKIKETPQTIPRTKLRKKVSVLLDKAEIMQEIKDMEQKGISTNDMFNIIVNQKKLIKKTCFYKYLKIIREQVPELHEQASRTNQ